MSELDDLVCQPSLAEVYFRSWKICLKRIAELDAENTEYKAGVLRATSFVSPDGYDEKLALYVMTDAVAHAFAFVADREYKRAEQAAAELAALNARIAYLTVDCDEYVFKGGRCYEYEQDTICPREPRCHDEDHCVEETKGA